MRYSKYFKPEQKILLRAIPGPSAPGRLDALSVYFHSGGPNHIDVTVPYRATGEEAFPFAPDMPFEILSDAIGVGIRLTGSFLEQRGENLIRLRINDDLQAFQRRLANRVDVTVGLRYTKGRGTLRTFRSQWEKNVQILAKTADPSKLPPFPRVTANLSRGGIRFRIKAPVEVADLCLLLLKLDDESTPICALAEVVWLEEEEVEGRRAAGMQFLSIMEEDQKRIESFTKDVSARKGRD